jgi:nitroreductase
MNLIETLHWRYATKRMNGTIVAAEKVNTILEAIRLAPTSMGVQPFHCFVISSKEMLTAISQEACKQAQITEGSHLVVFAAWKNFTLAHVEEYTNRILTTRNVAAESLEGFKAAMTGMTARPAEVNYQWAARQAYIALGIGLVAAAQEQVDATPMEGFNPAAMDKVLGLEEMGLTSVCLMMLGHRDATTDYLVHAKKVRQSEEQLFTII